MERLPCVVVMVSGQPAQILPVYENDSVFYDDWSPSLGRDGGIVRRAV